MDKIDYKQVFKECYGVKSHAPVLVDVPPMQFLMLDGRGDPQATPGFQASVEALFGLAFSIKFLLKKGPMALDFAVMPLEALWWADDMTQFLADRAAWQWTVMIMQPPVVDPALVDEAKGALHARKKASPLLAEIRLARFDEGKAVQLLHVGPFSEEGPAVQRLHAFVAAQGYGLGGKHHEIYLNDARRTAPEKLKTILRQPVVRGT